MAKRNHIHKIWRWHRLLGLVACVPLTIVALTGSLLALKDYVGVVWPQHWGDPWPLVYQIHRSLVAGWAGKLLISALGLSLWVMIWSGSKALIRVRGKGISRHALVGLCLGVPLATVGSLGAVLNYSEVLSAWLDPVPTLAAPLLGSGALGTAPAHVDLAKASEAAAVTAAQVHDVKDLVKIYPPREHRPYFIFYYRDNTRLYIDPATATLLKTRTSWSHWTSALLPLHSLKPLGVVGTFLLLVLALALVLLSSRGLLKLWQGSAGLMRRRSDALSHRFRES